MIRRIPMRHLYLLNTLAATFFWVYFLSQGFQAKGLLDGFYELQAQALSQYRLSIEPGPMEVFYHDASLYDGKYYFYWGVLPAAIHAGIRKILGRVVSSYLIAGGFIFCFLFFFQRIIGDIVDISLKKTDSHQFWLKLSSLPLLWFFLFNLPFPFNAMTWFFGRFSIYEQQIIFGLAAIMPVIFLLNRGLQMQNMQLVCFAAFLCALAAWLRGSWLIFAGFLVPAAFLCLVWQCNCKLRDAMRRKEVWWLIGSGVLLGGLLYMNYIRFDSFFDFGLKHQNAVVADYLRAQNGIFSPATKLWNFVFNIFAYYGSPGLVKGLGLVGKSSSNWEFAPTGFFHFNPQFLPVLVLVPLGLYRAFRKNRNLFLLMAITGLTAIYMNIFISAVGNFCIMRYFIEFYYFTLLFFFLVIVALIPYKFALPLAILLLAVHLPDNIEAFAKFEPELRVIDPAKNLELIAENTPRGASNFFIEKNAVWPRGKIALDNLTAIKKYNLIGIKPGSDNMIVIADVAAAFLIPGKFEFPSVSKNVLIIKDLKSIGRGGSVRFYVDGRYIDELSVNPRSSTHGVFSLAKNLRPEAPHQVLMIFIPENKKYLPPRNHPGPILTFWELALTSSQ